MLDRMYSLANRNMLSKKLYLMSRHVELKSFNIWNNMSNKMSYEGAYDITPELKWIVKFCYDLTDA